MPFTFSHPAIVLPFSSLTSRWVSMTGLIIGSVVPDFEYFIRLQVNSIYSHTIPGLFWFDLPVGLLAVFIYQVFVKDNLIENLPTGLNSRFTRFRGIYRDGSLLAYIIILCLSVLTGAASHLFWNAFTHPHGYFVGVLPMLSKTLTIGTHHLFVYKLIQHGSTILGAAFIITFIFLMPQGKLKKNRHISGFWLQIAIVSIIVLVIRFLTGLSINQYGNVIVVVIAGALLGLIVASVSPIVIRMIRNPQL